MSARTESDPAALLREWFGHDTFRPGQREVIDALLAGKSAAAVFPTGGGKSVCYQLPALVFSGLTLVVSPLIALMKDQIDALVAKQIAAARIDSSLTSGEYREVLDRIRHQQLRLLYVAPERFNNERFRELMHQIPISLFAVDEAHCISEWGHNFRPDYLRLARFAEDCGADRILALTATAPPKVLDDICEEFSISEECAIRTPFYRSNLTLLTTVVNDDDRDDILLERIGTRPPGATIVYVTLQKTAQHVAELLSKRGFSTRPYHAGMKAEVRAETQEWFLGHDNAIIAATIAFGMGIDKPNIRYIYHYNLSKSVENYAQEIGRAGRDGDEAICETLYCCDDLSTIENFIYGDTPDGQAVESMLRDVFGRGADFGVGHHQLASDHDIRDLVVRTLLTYLELDGYLEGGTPYYGEYSFQPRMTSAQILAAFQGERREFLAQLFRSVRRARSWLHIDLDRVARTDRCRSTTRCARARLLGGAGDDRSEVGSTLSPVSAVEESQHRRSFSAALLSMH